MHAVTTARRWIGPFVLLTLPIWWRALPAPVPLVAGAQPLAPATAEPSPSPATVTPAASPTAPTPTPLVTGAIEMSAPHAQGCRPIPVTVRFTATSRVDLVDAMRVVEPDESGCGGMADLIRERVWEPFARTRLYEGSGGPHYYWLSAGVQYRDRQGNVSPVYCVTIQGVCMGTETPLPTIDPTPQGGPIPVGTPLAPPPLAANAIAPGNAASLTDVGRLDPAGPAGSRVVGYTIDGSRIVLTGAGVRVLRARDGQLLTALPEVGADPGMPETISPDGTLLAVADQAVTGHLDLWGLVDGRHLRRHQGSEPVGDRVFAADGRSLAVGRRDGSFQLYDVATGALLADDRRVSFWDWVEVATHPREALVSVGSGDDGTVTERDALTGEVRRTQHTGVTGTIDRVLYRPDGALTAVVQGPRDFDDPTGTSSQPHTVVLWSADGRRSTLDTVNRTYLFATNWSPTGEWLALGLPRGHAGDQRVDVLLWPGTGAARSLAREPGLDIAGLAWSPDGRVLAVGLRSYYLVDGKSPGQVRLYDVATGKELARLPGVIEPVIAPDGAELIAAGDGVLDSALHRFAVAGAAPPTPTGSPGSAAVVLPWAGRP